MSQLKQRTTAAATKPQFAPFTSVLALAEARTAVAQVTPDASAAAHAPLAEKFVSQASSHAVHQPPFGQTSDESLYNMATPGPSGVLERIKMHASSCGVTVA